MKKALIVLLILAVAGGLFAQIDVPNGKLVFSGFVQTGAGVGMTDKKDDKPLLDFIANRGEYAQRAQIQAAYTSDAEKTPYGTFGMNFALRGQQSRLGTGSDWAASLPIANAWWRPNSIVYLQVGLNGPGGAGTLGGLDRGMDLFDHPGLKLVLTPIDGLTLGGHLLYGHDRLPTKIAEDVGFGLMAKYTLPNVFAAAANLRYQGWDSDQIGNNNQLRFGAGANFLGLSAMGFTALAADVGAFNFTADDKFLGVGERIEFKALGNNLVIGARAQQFFWMGEKFTGLDDSFIPMLFRGDLAYTIGRVTPAVQGVFTLGARPEWNWRNATEGTGTDSSFAFANGSTNGTSTTAGVNRHGKDAKGLSISPQVTINLGSDGKADGLQFVLGWNFRMDMTEDAKDTNGSGQSMQNLFYATVNLNY